MMVNFEGPLLVFGGPYSNLEALKAVYAVAKELQIPADHCVCTGDLVAYCADARLTTDFMIDWGCHVVMGNCEESLADGSDDCGCGFEEGTACDLLSKQWFDYSLKQMTSDHQKWMSNLPRQIDASLAGVSLQFIHGGMDEINRFVFASQTNEIKQELQKSDADLIIGGHSGIPFTSQQMGRLWINAGVIGMPANDGHHDTWYMLLTPQNDGLSITFHRLKYDYEKARSKMIQAGLQNGYADALISGLWPSLDVLPQAEKDLTGRANIPEDVFYKSA